MDPRGGGSLILPARILPARILPAGSSRPEGRSKEKRGNLGRARRRKGQLVRSRNSSLTKRRQPCHAARLSAPMGKLEVMRRTRIALLALVVTPLAAFVACGLDEGGFGPLDGFDAGSRDATAPDTGPKDSGPPCTGGNFSACDNVPDDWEPVDYLDNGASCQPGFDAGPKLVTDPAGGSCTCNCNSGSNVNDKCPIGPISTPRWDNSTTGPVCGTAFNNPTIVFNGAGCSELAERTISHLQGTAPPTKASCSCSSAPNNAGLTTKQVQLCTGPTNACKGVLCAKPHACIERTGDRSCPGDYPVKHTLGTEIDLECGSCGACSYSPTCATSVTLHPNTDCSSVGDPANIDGGCNAVTAAPARSYRSMKYVATLVSETFDASAPAPTREIAGDLRTVCCK